jgi:hypothetical protein
MPTPEIAIDSYGTVEGVAALAHTWTTDDTFLDANPPYEEATNPSLTSVINWINQVSAVLNTAMKKYGFVVPITTARGQLAAASIVEQLVADLCGYANSKGRFLSERFTQQGYSIWRAIRNDLDGWVLEYAPGLEQDGADREASNVDEIGFRSLDERGNPTAPIFQRDGFGNRFRDWDRR